MLLVSPNINFQNLQPVLERGFTPVVKSTIFLSCFITFPVVNILMIYPAHINDIHDAKKSIFYGYFLASSIIFSTIFLSILVLGSSITSESQFPTYLLGKEINLGTIFTRIEFIYGAIWINTQFILAALYFYTCTKGLSCILKLKDQKVIILPLGLIIFIMSMVTFPDSVYQAHWIKNAFFPNIIVLGLFLPVLLLVIHLIKNLLRKMRSTRINNKQ
jgi:spore germination protein KB